MNNLEQQILLQNNNPLISIIMPAFNAEKYINDAINSVINQTYQKWELLIIDDFSNDNTRIYIQEIASKEDRIKPIFRKNNGGKPSIAKNTAFEFIKGDYVAFLDSDDIWMSSKLEKQIKIMSSHNYGLSYTGGYFVDNNAKKISTFMPRYKCGYVFQKMLLKYEICNSSVLIKKDLLIKFNEDIFIGEDYNLFMDITYNNEVCSIKEELIKYRIHKQSITKRNTVILSEGTLITIREMDNKYGICKKYLFSYFICWLRAIRFNVFFKLNL